jgi:hypothetical protein
MDGGGTAMRMSDQESGEVEQTEDGVVVKIEDGVVDTRPDQYEGDLDEDDESDADGTSTPVI